MCDITRDDNIFFKICGDEKRARDRVRAVLRAPETGRLVDAIMITIFPWTLDEQFLNLIRRALPSLTRATTISFDRDPSVETRDVMQVIKVFEESPLSSLDVLYTDNIPCDAFYNLLKAQLSVYIWRHRRSDQDNQLKETVDLPYDSQLPPVPTDLELPELLDADIDLVTRIRSSQPVKSLKVNYCGTSCPDNQLECLDKQVIDCLRNCSETLTHLCLEVPDPMNEDSKLGCQLELNHLATRPLQMISEAAPKIRVLCLYYGRWGTYGSKDEATDVAQLCTALSSFKDLRVLDVEAVPVSGEQTLWHHLWEGRMSQQIAALIFEACPRLRAICLPCHRDSEFMVRYDKNDRCGPGGRWITWQREVPGAGTFFDLWDRDKKVMKSRLPDPPDVKTDAEGVACCGVCGKILEPETSSEEEEDEDGMDTDHDSSSVEAEDISEDNAMDVDSLE